MIHKIKSHIPIGVKLQINHWLKGENTSVKPSETGNKRIYFFLSAGCNNLGDVAISLAIEKFATNFFPEYELLQIPLYATLSYIKPITRIIKNDDIIFLVGGGNMGDMYEDIEFYRQLIIRHFPDNKIISFPQSIYFRSEKKAKKASAAYNAHHDLTLMARDKISFERMSNLFSSCRILLMPDIVMTLDKTKEQKRSGILLCLRNDWEKCNHDTSVAKILDSFGSSEVSYIDNMVSTRVPLSEKEKYIDSHLESILKTSILITDRLHGMIFGYITSTPTIFLENSTRKISACYDWIADCGYITPYSSMSELNTAHIKENFKASAEKIKSIYNAFAMSLREDLR